MLVTLAANEDPSLEEALTNSVVDAIVKKLEKVIAVYRPELFESNVLPRLDLQKAVTELD